MEGAEVDDGCRVILKGLKVLPVVKVECLIKGNPYPNPFTVFLLPEPFSSSMDPACRGHYILKGVEVNVLLHGKAPFLNEGCYALPFNCRYQSQVPLFNGQFLIPGDSPDHGGVCMFILRHRCFALCYLVLDLVISDAL